MRVRVGLLLCLGVVFVAVFATVEPRLHHTFPSMVDDWFGIEYAPGQVAEVLRLGKPEELRYRPGFYTWNALQWHTLGAPMELGGPRLWGVLRVGVLVLGVTLLALLLTEAGRARIEGRDPRWLLVAGVPLAVITPPALVVDLARFGPQEPLLVGCMALGAALLARSVDALLEPSRPSAATIAATVGGWVVWSFGVLQKETSLCVLLLAPFLVPTLRDQRSRWSQLTGARRVVVGLVAAGIMLPLVPMLARTIELSLADDRLYEDAAVGRSFVERFVDQLSAVGDWLRTPVAEILAIAACVLLAVTFVRSRIDWVSTGLLVVALGFVAFTAEGGVVASRYYLPPLVLVALVVARTSAALGSIVVVAAGLFLIGAGAVQARDGPGWAQWWVDGERSEEALVREAAARAAGGCDIDVTGGNVERVAALPILIPLAREEAGDCSPGERFVVVMDYGAPDETPADDPVLVACAPESEPVWSSYLGKILRCTS